MSSIATASALVLAGGLGFLLLIGRRPDPRAALAVVPVPADPERPAPPVCTLPIGWRE